MEPKTTLDEALSQLGMQLEELGWEPEEGYFVPFDGEQGDPKKDRVMFARLFVRKVKGTLKSAICKPTGGVRSGVNLAPDLATVAAKIALQEFNVEVDIDPMVEVFLHINFELFCSTP